jgi:hypothetical protein
VYYALIPDKNRLRGHDTSAGDSSSPAITMSGICPTPIDFFTRHPGHQLVPSVGAVRAHVFAIQR